MIGASTPQRRQAAEHIPVVAIGRRELDAGEALKQRHHILMILFPMEGKVRLVACFASDVLGRFPIERHISDMRYHSVSSRRTRPKKLDRCLPAVGVV